MVHHASAEVLAADGSGWEAVAPMSGPRECAAAGLLPDFPNGRGIWVMGDVYEADGFGADVMTLQVNTTFDHLELRTQDPTGVRLTIIIIMVGRNIAISARTS